MNGRFFSIVVPERGKIIHLNKIKRGKKLFLFPRFRSTTRDRRKKEPSVAFLLGECLIDRNQVILNDPKGIVVCVRCQRYYHRNCWAKAIQRRSLQGCPNCFAPIKSIKTMKL